MASARRQRAGARTRTDTRPQKRSAARRVSKGDLLERGVSSARVAWSCKWASGSEPARSGAFAYRLPAQRG